MKKLYKFFCAVMCIVLLSQGAYSQMAISVLGTANPDPSAILDLQSTSMGFLAPRMTTAQIAAISNPAEGLMVYQTDGVAGYYYNFGTPLIPQWSKVVDESSAGLWAVDGNNIYYNSGYVGIGTSSPGVGLDVVCAARITGELQFSNGATDGYVLTSDAAGNATWQAGSGSDNDWTLDGNDMYSAVSGNVGIGSTTPGAKLDVAGPGHFLDSLYVTGRPGRFYINGETNYEPYLKLAYQDVSKYTMHYRIPDGTYLDDYFMIDSDEFDELWGISDYGRVNHTYNGTSGSGYVLQTNNPYPSLDIENSNSSSNTQGINVSLLNTSAGSGSIGVASWNYGAGSGIYGENDTDGNFGYIGMQTWSVYGQHGATSNRGNFGTSSAGAMGIYNSEGFIGMLGTATAGVYGDLGGATQNITLGDYAVKGIGVENSGEAGNGYGYNATIGGVMGYNVEGTAYSFGVAGYTESSPDNRAGGVLGSFYNNNQWGSLAYRASGGTHYGGYFSNATSTGGGKAASQPSSSIGIGVWGDMMGAHINGSIYGLYAEGENYSIFASGDVYRTGADIHMQQDDNGKNTVMYTLVSPEMTIQTYGIGQMQAGKSVINFDQAFADVVSAGEPIIVTITPIGKSEGVYLEQVDGNGFSVAENNNGRSTVQFSWIAIGKRKGFENKSLPAEVIAGDYNIKVQRGLQNDGNENTNGEGLYYQNGQLLNGRVQEARTGNSPNVSTRAMFNETDLGIVAPLEDKSEKTASEDEKKVD